MKKFLATVFLSGVALFLRVSVLASTIEISPDSLRPVLVEMRRDVLGFRSTRRAWREVNPDPASYGDGGVIAAPLVGLLDLAIGALIVPVDLVLGPSRRLQSVHWRLRGRLVDAMRIPAEGVDLTLEVRSAAASGTFLTKRRLRLGRARVRSGADGQFEADLTARIRDMDRPIDIVAVGTDSEGRPFEFSTTVAEN